MKGILVILVFSIILLCFSDISGEKFRSEHSVISRSKISSAGLIELRESQERTTAKSDKFNLLAKNRGIHGYDFQTAIGIIEYCDVMGFQKPKSLPVVRSGQNYYIKSNKGLFRYKLL